MTRRNHVLQERVTSRAQARPHAVALVLEGKHVAYGALESLANRLAHALIAAGCRRGDRICFAIPKSPAAVIAILAILKAECIYVPLDLASPPARIARILRSSRPAHVVATSVARKLLEEIGAQHRDAANSRLCWLDAAGSTLEDGPIEGWQSSFCGRDLESMPESVPPCRTAPEDPAYIFFTSGSTGEPKGVVITHANVTGFLEWALPYFGIDAGDRISGHPPLHFDLSVFDLFGSLTAGAELHLVPTELNLLPHKLAAFMRESALTQWFSVPSVLRGMAKHDVVLEKDFPDLKRLLWCGEVLPTPALIYWMERLPHVRFTNLYGPTEATIASSYHTLDRRPADATSEVPIGRACAGEELLVLDRQLRPAPVGVTADLYIAGVGLSPGYWEDPEKTREVFVERAAGGTLRLYKTGDLARLGPDGLVYFGGRSDTQIKSRGYRIELGEIEAALHSLEGIADGAVVAHETDGFEGSTICCAYVTRDAKPLQPASLRSSLRRLLPGYMIPGRWIQLPELPKNANGKVDRKKLEEVFMHGEPTPS